MSKKSQLSKPSSIIGLRSLGLIIALGLMAACQKSEQSQPQNTATDPQVSTQSESAILDSTVDDTSEADLISEGFYGDASVAESDSSPVATELDSASSESIVEDIGFSNAEHDHSSPDETSNYCLGQEAGSAAEITAAKACQQISERLASVTKSGCESAQLQPSQCSSVNGFPIFFREFPPLEGRSPQGRILIIGGTHGDELTSVSVVFRWIEKLNKYHSGLFHWHVVPLMNPDGVLKAAAQRTNENGVDLNRNLPTDDWEENALNYWRHQQGENPRRYPGENPASEPETQWLIDEINSFKPDAIISVHAPYGVVDFDALVLNTAPKSLGILRLNLLGTFPGSLGNYAGIDRDIPVITLELPHAWEMPSKPETNKIWEDVVSWLKENVNKEIARSD